MGKRVTMAEHKRAKARGVHDRVVGSKVGTAIMILAGGRGRCQPSRARQRHRREGAAVMAEKYQLDWSLIPGTKREQINLAKGTRKPIAIKHGGRGKYDILVFGIYIGHLPNKEQARHAAHMIGRYKLELGDFVDGYTEGY